MKKYIIDLLDKLGIVLITKRKLSKYQIAEIEKEYPVLENKVDFVKAQASGGLKEKLITEGKIRWLEIGCGGTFDDNFTYIDIFPDTLVNKKGRYYRIDIVNTTDEALEPLGKFDLIRMQHVFEHFTPENGRRVLENCAKLLSKNGYILISTPDLKKYIEFYLSGQITENFEWALHRIPKESPKSFYFSIFSHSLLHEKHEWCYDAEGLIYQLAYSRKFKNIQEISLTHPWTNIPFTHNRPNEDVCVVAQLS